MSLGDLVESLRNFYEFPEISLSEYLLLLNSREEVLSSLARFHSGKAITYPLPRADRLVDKSSLRTSFADFLSKNLNDLTLWWKTTSGTSGRPLAIPYEASFYLDFKYGVFHKIWFLQKGIPLSDKPYLALVITDVEGDINSICVDPLYSTGVVARVSIDVSDNTQLVGVYRLLEKMQPEFFSTKPSVLAALLSVEPKIDTSIEITVVGGAALSEDLREQVKSRFNGAVSSIYAISEVGVVASQCRDGRMHIFETEVSAICEDATKSSEIIVSNNNNKALPLTSYKTGDTGRIVSGQCSCGLSWRWIEQIEGRTVPLFKFFNGVCFSPTRFNSFIRHFTNVTEFQISLIKSKYLEIKIEIDDTLGSESIDEMKNYFVSLVPNGVSVNLKNHYFDKHEKFARYRVLE
jgi:phenylacetate-coenzyme A ligase PaaK-like adenylate-forming protein